MTILQNSEYSAPSNGISGSGVSQIVLDLVFVLSLTMSSFTMLELPKACTMDSGLTLGAGALGFCYSINNYYELITVENEHYSTVCGLIRLVIS